VVAGQLFPFLLAFLRGALENLVIWCGEFVVSCDGMRGKRGRKTVLFSRRKMGHLFQLFFDEFSLRWLQIG
jgi:hypothetical protein